MSEARKTAAPAISSTCPGRAIGIMCLAPSGSPSGETRSSPSVTVRSGASALTRIPLRGQFERRGLGVVDDARLGGGVGGIAGGRAHPLDRRHVDNASG